MKLNKILKNGFLIVVACLALSACATSKKSTGQMQGDVYTGTDTVEYLASGVPDRVFFATNESVLTTASRETLIRVSLEAVVNTDSLVAKNTLSGTPEAKYSTVSVPV